MKITRTVGAGIAGTTLMTLFSYLASAYSRKNFKEPELLAVLTKRLLPAEYKPLHTPAGWAIHYGMGTSLSLLYEKILSHNNSRRSTGNGLLLGFASGLAGILIWKAVFSLHPLPPKTDFKRFYTQLLLAHLVFAVTTLLSNQQGNAGKAGQPE